MNLTDDDKQWFAGQRKGVEDRLAAQVDGRIARVDKRVDRVVERVERSEERLASRVEHLETALLTEFHKWASPLEMRMRTHSAVLRALGLESKPSQTS